MADDATEFNPGQFFEMLRKSASVRAGAIMFGQAQVAYYNTLKENMPEEQAFALLADTNGHVIRGIFSAVGPVCEVLLKMAAMAELFESLKPEKQSDKQVPGDA
jgi:hypothetical protein